MELSDCIYKKAVKHYGDTAQLRKAQEECGELVATIGQWIDGRLGIVDLATEVADVEIMCKQIRIIIGDKFVDAEKIIKTKRLEKRIIGTETLPHHSPAVKIKPYKSWDYCNSIMCDEIGNKEYCRNHCQVYEFHQYLKANGQIIEED